ncbi:prephenate dehydratase domain-containing protein [Brevundimonas sp.]|jgi:prephenate dehydratase|uniref:prephenate dehydratase domain-containing protein n=1 Tax=Brevundimonas sp. TaxID=1871086 RepID=UPI002E0E9B3B|nr:prephenate dehydratase domain-containing protein [Brevundimonas sp.]
MSGQGGIGGETERAGRVAYQGAPGAFSHEACAALRPWDVAVGFDTFQQALDAVGSGDCDCALIPVENAIVGRVEPAATLVEASGLHRITEVWRPIRLALMGVDGARLSDLKTVESHPVALAQCQPQIAALKLTQVEAFDTAGAARAVADAEDRTRAALAPPPAAEIYGLTILRNDMQEMAENRTRFVLLCREPA